jgi:AP-3 complex subunit beta
LLWSQNSAVVMATAAVHWVFASKTDLKKIVKPLLFLLRSSYDSQYVVSKQSEDVNLTKHSPGARQVD